MKTSITRRLACMSVVAGVSLPLAEAAKKKPPANWDGLELRKVKGLDLVYVRPNVEFPPYKSVQLDQVGVEFAKNWERSVNSNSYTRRPPSAEDMQRIKDKLGELMLEGFKQELVEHGYPVVDTPADDTLLVRTAVIDLYINAPENSDPGITRTYTTSAGAMTLVLEARDGPTGQLQARVIDGRSDTTNSYLTWTNRNTNIQDAKRLIGEWARRLRLALDRLNGKAA